MKLSQVGEKGFIARALELFAGLWIESVLKPGDDASSHAWSGLNLIMKIDGLSAYSSKYPWLSWRDLGWRAATMCASDLVAKGGRPFAFMLSVGAPGEAAFEDLVEALEGYREAVEVYGGVFAGGDTNSSQADVWLDAACLGISRRAPIPRSASPGNEVIITGLFGLSGLARIYYGLVLEGKIPVVKIPREVVSATSRPRARAEAVEILERHRECIEGSSDVSDSLAETLYALSQASGHVIELDDIPVDPVAEKISAEVGADLEDVVLNGGEEFELVLVARRGCSEDLVRDLKSAGIPSKAYGRVLEERGVEVRLRRRRIPRSGYEHFRSGAPAYKSPGKDNKGAAVV